MDNIVPNVDAQPQLSKNIMLPIKFKGEVHKLAEFLIDYVMYADAYGWTEEQRCVRLPLHMEGVARRVIMDMPQEDRTWVNIGTKLNEKLLIGTSAKMHRQLFQDRIQKSKETVQQFAYDLKVLVIQAYAYRSPAK